MPKRMTDERIRALRLGWRMLTTLNVSEAAVVLGISRNTLADAVKNDQIPYIQLGNRILFPVDALQDWLKCPDRTERVAVKAAAEMTGKPHQADAVGFTAKEFAATAGRQKCCELRSQGFAMREEDVRAVAKAYGADGDELWRLMQDEESERGAD